MWLANVRDIAIVLVALQSIVIGILLAIMLLEMRKLVRLLRDEVAPVLHAASETLHTVQGTASFVSENVVDPVIKVSSYTTGTLQALRSLLVIRRKLKG